MKRYQPVATTLSILLACTLGGAALADDDDELELSAKLRGSNEVPVPVETDTRGRAVFEVDEYGDSIDYRLTIRRATNILGAAGAHIHCGGPDVNGPVAVFLAGVHPGGLQGTVRVRGTLTDQNILDPSCGATIAELIDSMVAGDTYVNVHSLDNPGGEVRGQIGLDDDD